jgi:hypothetical protein
MYKLSPSDFAYLYEECKLCYCLKVKYGITQPSMPMPGVFSAINTRLQGNLIGKNLKDLSIELPDGEVIVQEGWVDSKKLPNTDVFIKGKYDLLVKNPDGRTHTLIDLKISAQSEDKIAKYQSQLSAYKFALENPKYDESLKVTKMGLLVFYPDGVKFENELARVDFPPKWLEVPIGDDGFFKFINSVNELLKGPLPDESINCKWCQYRHVSEKISHDEGQEDIPF